MELHLFPQADALLALRRPSQHKGHIEKWVLTAAALYVNLWKVPRSRSEQNATNARWLCSSQWSLCQVRHTVLLWQPAELWEPSALWARHWISGLSSSGSLSVQYSTVPLDGKCSHRLALCFAVSPTSPDFYFSLHSPASFGFKVVQTSDEEAARGNNRQCQCCVLDLGSWITADFLPFPAIHCWGPSQCQGQSNTC